MVAQPTYIKIVKGPYKGMSGMHAGKERELHIIKLDNGDVILAPEGDFVQKKIPKFVMITRGPYKGYTGFYRGMRAGKLVIILDSSGKEVTAFREDVIPNPSHPVVLTVSKESFSPEKRLSEGKASRSYSSAGRGSVSKQAGFDQQYEMNIDMPQTPFTVFFTELTEILGISYAYTETIKHINTINNFYESNSSLLTTKESKKLLCIAYIFILFNQQDANVPYNYNFPLDLVRPNDDPSYILAVSNKLGYIKSIDNIYFNQILDKLLEFLNLSIIPSKVYNRYKSPENKPPRVNKPIRFSLSPLRFVMKKKIGSKGQTVQRLSIFNSKEEREKIRKNVRSIINKDKDRMSQSKFNYLTEYTDNMDNPKYILELKNNPDSEKSKFILKYHNLILDLIKIEKNNFYNQNAAPAPKYKSNDDILNKIYKREKERLNKGLEVFKDDNDSKYVLEHLIKNFETIINLSSYKKQKLKAELKVQKGREALLTEAIIALSDKVSMLTSYNKLNDLDMKFDFAKKLSVSPAKKLSNKNKISRSVKARNSV